MCAGERFQGMWKENQPSLGSYEPLWAPIILDALSPAWLPTEPTLVCCIFG